MDSSIVYRIFLIFLIITFSSASAIEFKGKFIQGHFILGKTNPKAKIIIGKKEVKVSKEGFFVFGIDRDRKFDLVFTKIIDGKTIAADLRAKTAIKIEDFKSGNLKSGGLIKLDIDKGKLKFVDNKTKVKV